MAFSQKNFGSGVRSSNLFDPLSKAPFKLSRSKIDLFIECERCFYLDRRLGVARPAGFPFTLNSAVDHLLKKEFDIHRVKKTPHPLMKAYGLDAVPFAHKDLERWRKNFEGVRYEEKDSNFLVTGAIDDVWVNKKDELMVVDYKATSKDSEVNLDAEWQDGYKRQMEVYQWLLSKNGFTVSSTGYFVYANGLRDREAFDGRLEFHIKLIPYEGNTSWILPTLGKIRQLLMDEALPKASDQCEYCRYRGAAGNVINKIVEEEKKGRAKVIKIDPVRQSLFD